MSINKKCLARLRVLGLPMTVDVIDTSGISITTAEIHTDGRITDLTTGITYGSPSNLRAALIEPNGPTYTQLIYGGTSLRSLGVGP